MLPPDPIPRKDPRPQNYGYINQGSDPLPPLPWPTVPLGPNPLPPILTNDQGVPLVDDLGNPLRADQWVDPFPPPYPTNVVTVGLAGMGDPDPPLLDPPALAQVPSFPEPNVPPPPVIPPTIEDILQAEP